LCLTARGEFWTLERMLEQGSLDINRMNSQGYTPLALAIRYGHWKTIDVLLKHKAIIGPGGNELLEGALGRHYFETAARMIATGMATLGPEIMNQRMPPKTIAWLVRHQSAGVAVCWCICVSAAGSTHNGGD
jgi:ankyrin repeat protein